MRSSEEPAREVSHDQRSTSFFGWLFSHKHFHVKLLSGTAAGVIAIIFFAAFLFIATYRNYHQETLRAHTIDVMRMSSVVLNDIAILDEARDLMQALQNEEQIVLNERIRDQEWAAQSTQILDVLPRLERSVVEMEREKQGFLLTGDNTFAEAFKRAASSFSSYHG